MKGKGILGMVARGVSQAQQAGIRRVIQVLPHIPQGESGDTT